MSSARRHGFEARRLRPELVAALADGRVLAKQLQEAPPGQVPRLDDGHGARAVGRWHRVQQRVLAEAVARAEPRDHVLAPKNLHGARLEVEGPLIIGEDVARGVDVALGRRGELGPEAAVEVPQERRRVEGRLQQRGLDVLSQVGRQRGERPRAVARRLEVGEVRVDARPEGGRRMMAGEKRLADAPRVARAPVREVRASQ